MGGSGFPVREGFCKTGTASKCEARMQSNCRSLERTPEETIWIQNTE